MLMMQSSFPMQTLAETRDADQPCVLLLLWHGMRPCASDICGLVFISRLEACKKQEPSCAGPVDQHKSEQSVRIRQEDHGEQLIMSEGTFYKAFAGGEGCFISSSSLDRGCEEWTACTFTWLHVSKFCGSSTCKTICGGQQVFRETCTQSSALLESNTQAVAQQERKMNRVPQVKENTYQIECECVTYQKIYL